MNLLAWFHCGIGRLLARGGLLCGRRRSNSERERAGSRRKQPNSQGVAPSMQLGLQISHVPLRSLRERLAGASCDTTPSAGIDRAHEPRSAPKGPTGQRKNPPNPKSIAPVRLTDNPER